MSKRLVLIILSLATISCDKQLKSEHVKTWEAQEVATCHKTDVCFTCGFGMGFDGKFKNDCRIQLSPMCPGHRNAVKTFTTTRNYYESGAVREWTTSTVKTYLTECR